MRSLLLLSSFFVACGAVAGWLVAGLLPPQPRGDELQTWTEDYRLERATGDAFVVSDGRWLRVLRLIPDFDLHLDVELGPDMDLDLLVRHVEPRLVQGRVEPFTERFVALRLTTGRDGPAWRTREQALFGERGVGSSLAPGIPATVWMQGRGRLLRANVAGRWTPWCEAEDTEGMFALVAHGGTAALRRLVIENRGVANAWLARRSTWLLVGAGLGLLIAAFAGVRPVPWAAAACLGAFLVAYVVWRLVGAELQPLRMPPPAALLALLAAPTAIVVGILAAAWLRVRWLQLALLAIAVVVWAAADSSSRDLLRSDTGAVDAVFGPDAGNSLSEALAQIVRGPFGLHSPAEEQHGVFLLGGRLLYGRLGPTTEHLEPLLRGELRGKLGRSVAVVSLPTEEGRAHVRQQWAMFAGFYTGYHPRVIVLGVPVTEGDRGAAASVVQDTLVAVREYARSHDAALVLFTDAGLAADLLAVLRSAERDGVPLVVADDGEPAAAVAKKLAAAILPLLP
ncbi:MAG: hypothetical protein JNM25_06840 [Planctomycetes bacterium]|nr:hypothetical protein [Planctomycetota bacterium]